MAQLQARRAMRLVAIVGLALGVGWVLVGGRAAAAPVRTTHSLAATAMPTAMATKTTTTSTSIGNPGPTVPLTGGSPGGAVTSPSSSTLPTTGGAADGSSNSTVPFLALGFLLIALGASAYRLRRS